MRVGAKTDQGLVRELNEDTFGYKGGLFVVADGMGGHCAGEVASAIAVETVLALDLGTTASNIATDLSQAVIKANQAILLKAEENPEFLGMGTTIVILQLQEKQAYFTHVGDSRIYHLTAGNLAQLTIDHSLVAELVKNGGLSKAEASSHPQRNVLTRALGTKDELELEVNSVAIKPGDKFLLCSDGLTSTVNEKVIAELLAAATDPQEIAAELVTAANQSGGNDNITAIVIEI